ncbi:muconolactone Delta-isomerase family protein [Telluribacter sp.]|jgi:muconolactone delta-isomerase|uniref:muconolactone Delta-isomerase family protein n=1 Tax=Telluribacter sp. TaxID=1978767 RepID=UPI002E0EB585|nr:muconolactone Delta-isomerase family protein [Telluribacter sp.]
MSQFMVEIALSEVMTEEFTQKIPAQRQKVNEMMEQGVLMSYALTEDRSKLWCVVKADSEYEVMTIMSEFPLVDYMDFIISELMFNNMVALRLPLFSLN